MISAVPLILIADYFLEAIIKIMARIIRRQSRVLISVISIVLTLNALWIIQYFSILYCTNNLCDPNLPDYVLRYNKRMLLNGSTEESESVQVGCKDGSCVAVVTKFKPLTTVKEVPSQMLPKDHQWQYIRGQPAAVYSAFCEQCLAKSSHCSVVVIGLTKVVENRKTALNLSCHLQYPSNVQEVVKARVNIFREVQNKDYSAAKFTCDLRNCSLVPSSVSISHDDTSRDLNNSLTVNNHDSEDYSHRFGLCISVLYNNYSAAFHIVEAFEMYKILGVNKITIYNASQHTPLVDCVLHSYVDDGLLEVVRFDFSSKDIKDGSFKNSESKPWDIHFHGQIVQFNDCFQRNKRKAQYLLFNDIDEVIVPNQTNNYKEFLENYSTLHPNAQVFVFRNYYFDSKPAISLTRALSDIDIDENELFFMKNHRRVPTYRPIPWPTYRTKYIVKTAGIDSVGIHTAYPKYGHQDVIVNPTDGFLHHYRQGYSSRSDFKEKSVIDKTLFRHKHLLIAAVKIKLRKLRKQCLHFL